jgi:hypothetical protein
VKINTAKQQFTEYERNLEIEKDNAILYKKIRGIMGRTPFEKFKIADPSSDQTTVTPKAIKVFHRQMIDHANNCDSNITDAMQSIQIGYNLVRIKHN